LKQDDWKPAVKISDVLLALLNLLEIPQPDDPLNVPVAEEYKNDHKKFEKTAKEWTKKYAT